MAERHTIGARLRCIRRDRALTQEELAERAEVSRDLVSKLEQGRRESARVTTLIRLAGALDVDLSELTGKRDRIGGERDGGRVMALRDTLLSPAALPGLDNTDDGEPTPLSDLTVAVERAAAAYWGGDFGELLTRLPELISETRLTANTMAEAKRPLALAYDLAASLMVHLGRDDLAAVGAERAITTAHDGDDELLWATLHATYAWVLLHQGRVAEAERLAAGMAARIEPAFTADPHAIAAWGNLLMTALAPAAGAGHDVSEYISLAGAGAERIGRRVNLYQTSFGPATVAMQATHAYTVLREPGRALKSARRIGRGDLRGISYGRHLLDVAQAHVDARHHRAAVERLTEANEVSPVWFRHQGVARSLVREVRERETRPSPAIRSLARSLSLGS